MKKLFCLLALAFGLTAAAQSDDDAFFFKRATLLDYVSEQEWTLKSPATVRDDVVVIVGFENLSRIAGQIGFCDISKTTKLAARVRDRAPYVRAVVPTGIQKAYQFALKLQ